MQICKNCGKEIKWYTIVDGVKINLGRRSHCLDCNPIGSRNFWGNKQIVKGHRTQEREFICKTCGKKYVSSRRNKECFACKSNRARRKTKIWAVQLMGGKCKLCNYNKSLAAMDFHHLDKSKKDKDVSVLLQSKSREELANELKKCVLLCCRCHREVHDGVTVL